MTYFLFSSHHRDRTLLSSTWPLSGAPQLRSTMVLSLQSGTLPRSQEEASWRTPRKGHEHTKAAFWSCLVTFWEGKQVCPRAPVPRVSLCPRVHTVAFSLILLGRSRWGDEHQLPIRTYARLSLGHWGNQSLSQVSEWVGEQGGSRVSLVLSPCEKRMACLASVFPQLHKGPTTWCGAAYDLIVVEMSIWPSNPIWA